MFKGPKINPTFILIHSSNSLSQSREVKSMAPPTMEIHDDIAFSILSKLPLKSLKRFTCAHKTWAHLLENPHFMAIFRTNFLSKHHSYYDDTSLVLLDYRREPHLLLGDKFENKVKLDWPYLFSTVIVGCGMHGFFCLDLGEQCELWNPATKELRIIPPSPFVESQRDQITSATAFGFGYDNLNDDFKVIRLLRFFPYLTFSEQDNKPMIQEPLPCLEIYSLRSNSWRKLDIDRFLDPLPDTGSVSYLNGMCHWLATGYENHHKTQYLVSFNMSSEILFTTPLPLDMGRVTKFLVVLNGSIAVILRYGKTYHISILCELGVKESWTKLFTFECLLGVRPIGVGKNGYIFFRKQNGELALFDLSTNMLEDIAVKDIAVKRQLNSYQLIIYKESILPIGRTS